MVDGYDGVNMFVPLLVLDSASTFNIVGARIRHFGFRLEFASFVLQLFSVVTYLGPKHLIGLVDLVPLEPVDISILPPFILAGRSSYLLLSEVVTNLTPMICGLLLRD